MNSFLFVIVFVILGLTCRREAATIYKPISSHHGSTTPRKCLGNVYNIWQKIIDLSNQSIRLPTGIHINIKDTYDSIETSKEYPVLNLGIVNSNSVRKKRYRRLAHDNRKNDAQFAQLDDTGIYYEPADTYIPTQIYNKLYFYVPNPIRNNNNVQPSDVAHNSFNNNTKLLSERIVLNQNNTRMDADARSLKTPLYLDIDIQKAKSRENNDNIGLIDNPIKAEEFLTECIDLYVFVFSKNGNTSYRQVWNRNKTEIYESLTDPEIEDKLNNVCNKAETMLQDSMQEILHRRQKEQFRSADSNNDIFNVESVNIATENHKNVDIEQNNVLENFQTTTVDTYHAETMLTTEKVPTNKLYQSTQTLPQEEINDNLELYYDHDNETMPTSLVRENILNNYLNVVASNNDKLYGDEINDSFTTERDQFQDSSSADFISHEAETSTTIVPTTKTIFEDMDTLESELISHKYIAINNDSALLSDSITESYENLTTTYANTDFIVSEDKSEINTTNILINIEADEIAQESTKIDSNTQSLISTNDINLTTMKYDTTSYLNSVESITSDSDAISTTFSPLTENSQHDRDIITITDSANKYSHEAEINEANMQNLLEVNGKVYFIFNERQIPMRFVQKPDGEIKMGIDGHYLCKILLDDPKHKSLLLTKLCSSSFK